MILSVALWRHFKFKFIQISWFSSFYVSEFIWISASCLLVFVTSLRLLLFPVLFWQPLVPVQFHFPHLIMFIHSSCVPRCFYFPQSPLCIFIPSVPLYQVVCSSCLTSQVFMFYIHSVWYSVFTVWVLLSLVLVSFCLLFLCSLLGPHHKIHHYYSALWCYYSISCTSQFFVTWIICMRIPLLYREYYITWKKRGETWSLCFCLDFVYSLSSAEEFMSSLQPVKHFARRITKSPKQNASEWNWISLQQTRSRKPLL